MKKYGCHRLYISYNQFLRQSVVTIDDRGKVVHYAPLEEEIHSTEWLGGIIILSESPHLFTDNIQEWFERQSGPTSGSIYAWHLSNFDFEKECITPQSILRRL